MAHILKIRNKRNGLYFNKATFKFTRGGSKMGILSSVRSFIPGIVYNLNLRNENEQGRPYTEDDFEIVRFELVEVGIVN